ncbi:MAG: right-handed parallel beta-helix repeat-containing protein [Myxococcota bacterium]
MSLSEKRFFRPIAVFSLALIGLILGPITALAGPGAIEINQTCATQTGCFVGDAPGFPVTPTASTPRSLRLTSDLIVSDPFTTAIDFAGAFGGSFRFDLGGFEIRGPVTCTPTCTPSGDGVGVLADDLAQLTVENGAIRGMTGLGISAQSASAQIRNMHFERNGDGGLVVGASSLIEHVSAYRNDGTGIQFSSASVVRNCTSRANVGAGISAGDRSTVASCAVTENSGSGVSMGAWSKLIDSTVSFNSANGVIGSSRTVIRGNTIASNDRDGINLEGGRVVIMGNSVTSSGRMGIRGAQGSVITDNLVADSGEDGIFARDGSTIRGNSTLENGTTTDHDGIYCTLGCTVQENTARANAGFGLRFDSGSSVYSGNAIGANNAAGTVVNGRDAGGNVCGTTLGCP